MSEPLLIKVEDLRRSGICPDARIWFARQGLDWRDFVRNGIDSEILVVTGNAIAIRVVEEARARAGVENGR